VSLVCKFKSTEIHHFSYAFLQRYDEEFCAIGLFDCAYDMDYKPFGKLIVNKKVKIEQKI